MKVFGQVVSVELDTQVAKKDGGTYPGARLTYRDSSGKIAEQAFHQNTFKFKAPLKASLASLSPGDNIEIEKEKNANGFWEVQSISKAGASPANPQAANPSSPPPQSAGKGNWETKEEREARQLYIIRQSSIGHAVELLAANGGKKNTVGEVLATAEQFVDYVLYGPQGGAVAEAFVEDDDIPM